jgi:hypothetical protein
MAKTTKMVKNDQPSHSGNSQKTKDKNLVVADIKNSIQQQGRVDTSLNLFYTIIASLKYH